MVQPTAIPIFYNCCWPAVLLSVSHSIICQNSHYPRKWFVLETPPESMKLFVYVFTHFQLFKRSSYCVLSTCCLATVRHLYILRLPTLWQRTKRRWDFHSPPFTDTIPPQIKLHMWENKTIMKEYRSKRQPWLETTITGQYCSQWKLLWKATDTFM